MMNYQPKSLLKYDVCCFSLFSNKTNKLKMLSLVAALVPFNFPFTRTDCIFSILLISRTDLIKKIYVCVFRYPSAAVDSVENVAPARGGGAHRSGVSELD